MEYLFLIVFVIVVGVYFSDRKGWNATAKRISTIVRANLEAGKPVKALEPVKDQDDWVQRFKAIENPELAVAAPVEPVKHMLVRTSYYKTASYGLWPQWHCKCGAKGHEATGSYSNGMGEAKRRAKRAAESHAKTAIEAEAMRAKTNGAFSW